MTFSKSEARVQAPILPTQRHSRHCQGFALVLVLAFVVLLTVIVVAFYSHAVLQRQVADSSANQSGVELFAQGAVDTILGDLKQEIADPASSTTKIITTPPTTTSVYYPKAAAAAVPALAGSSGTNGLENLLKRSAAGIPFYPGGPNRAANSSTTNPSKNGRQYSTGRWNKHLLLEKANTSSTTDLTPTNAFAAPDWILVARDGSNPALWNEAMRWTQSNATTVIGRYAYAIYNEGGLLDANVAGYPSTVASSDASFKSAVSYADLTQIGMSQANVDALVSWRNAASYAGDSEQYLKHVAENPTGFVKTANTRTAPDGGTDRQFTSRQQLIEFFNNRLGATSNAELQNTLQYLGSFSRDIDQPAFTPDPSRPKIVSGMTGNYRGGNNQSQLDSLANPSFPEVRVATSFTRNNASVARVGEPLVKKRFALKHLAWITCKGPSASRAASSDEDIAALKSAGITESFLEQGTEANILRFFGLSWDPTQKRWTYDHGDPGNGISCLPELVTGNVDPARGIGTITGAPREPDFFELLKAAINVGSLGKACFSSDPLSSGYQALRDTNVNEQIIQIGANIIDQFDADGYPTRIWFQGATGSGHEFRGVEDLPYIYRVRTHVVQLTAPDPNIAGPAEYNPSNNTVKSGSSWVPFVSTGTAACLLVPEVWNPHDGSRPLPAMGPTEFHFTTDTTDPDKNFTYGLVSTFSIGSTGNNTFPRSHDPTTRKDPPFDPALFSDASRQSPLYGSGPNQNNDLQFSVTHPHQFREPTALLIPGLPAGSDLKYGPKDWVVGGASFGAKTPDIPLNAEKTAMLELASGGGSRNPYLGICVGVAPMAWITSVSGNYSYVRTISNSPRSAITSPAVTHQLWYRDPFGTLRIYDEKYSGYSGIGGFEGQTGFSWAGGSTVPGVSGTPRLGDLAGTLMVFTDPRTRRWGPGMRNGSDSRPIIAQPTSLPYPVPSPVCLPWRLNESHPGSIFAAASAPFYPNDATGWYPATPSMSNNNILAGLLSQNNPAAPIGANAPSGTGWASKSYFYCDPDGVARRAMAAFVPFSLSSPASTPVGLPNVVASVVDPVTAWCSPATSSVSYAPASGVSLTVSPGQNLGRPIVLNRPFKTVGELAYSFSDTPWRNLDLSTPESGNTALLDVFCIHDNTASDAIIAGKVNLNTRQVPVIKAILAGAAKDEGGAATLTSSEIERLAKALVDRTSGTNEAMGQGALRNPAELVGRYIGGTVSPSTGTGAIYRGFSEDLSLDAPAPLPANVTSIQRFRETPLRALSSVGTARCWNLLIDLVAQRGRYPASAMDLDGFLVEGETRLWVHVAVDRATGEIIDKQVEVVSE